MVIWMSKKAEKRTRNWCFTYFQDEGRAFNEWESIINQTYLILGDEICPETGRKHLQGYVEFKDDVSLKTCQRRLCNYPMHCEWKKGTNKEASDYCKKGVQSKIEWKKIWTRRTEFWARC